MYDSSSFPSIDKSVVYNISHLNNSRHQLFALRDDLIHPIISGNKWRKLKFAFEKVKQQGLSGIQSYGGAYSNHSIALACASHILGVACRIYIRGEELNEESNEVLKRCHSFGAQLHFLTRKQYQIQKLTYGVTEDNFLSIPEGGACIEGLKGVFEMGNMLMDYDVIAVAQGTTTTSLGILLSTPESSCIWVFPVLSGFDSLYEMEKLANQCGYLKKFKEQRHRINVMDGYTFGGYAKGHSLLINTLKNIGYQLPFPLDSIYTAKTFVGFMNESEKMNEASRMIFVHTGGYAMNPILLT
ncbi:MAG: 1-aminocyclopropane-1-carboxylate deaminase/D-cysteine desulfhydrase [Bacteroidota bacterium]